MSESDEINVDDVDFEDTLLSAALKLKRNRRTKNKKPKRTVKLSLYQSRNIETKEKKKKRRNNRKCQKSNTESVECDTQYNVENVNGVSYCKHNDTATTIGYEDERHVEYMDFNEFTSYDDSEETKHHDVTDACMSAMSYSFAINEKGRNVVQLESGNDKRSSDKNVQTSPNHEQSNVSFEEEMDIDPSLTFKERCFRKLTNKDLITTLVDKITAQN